MTKTKKSLTTKKLQIKKTKLQQVTLEELLDPKDREVVVELRNVDVIFGKGSKIFKAINDVSFNIYKGEVLGIVGESGSGKTTTGNAIMGLVNRSRGYIKLMGRLIPAKSSQIKGEISNFMVNKVQMIFQDPANSLNPYKTIEKIVAEGLENIDLKSSFIKHFDSETARSLAKILHNQPQPKILSEVSVSNIEKMVAQNKFAQIKTLIYEDGLEALKTRKLDSWKLAATFLTVRADERSKILTGRRPTKLIKRKLIIEMLESVGLSERILQRYPLEFSGGQQQRIGISRAVVLRPKLLIADEPISALDVSIQAQVVNIFNELKDKLHLTIAFIAHDLRMVEYLSDRIIVMYKGVIVEVGPALKICKDPIHPYAKSLLDAVPSIDSKKGSLLGYKYDSTMHNYELDQAGWIKVDEDRFVRGEINEVERWLKKDWNNYN